MKPSPSVAKVRRAFIFSTLAAMALLAAPSLGRAADAEPRITFADSLAPLPVVSTTGIPAAGRLLASDISPVSAAQLAAPLHFSVAMRMRHFDEFQRRVASGETVPFEEIEAKYLPLSGDYAATRKWLVAQGFTVTKDDARRLSIFARGTAAQIQTAFAVTMHRVTVEGVAYTAAATAPSLPASVAKGVLGVHGLQPYFHAHKHSHAVPMATGPTPQFSNATPYIPSEIRKAYDAATLTAASTTLTGANQKIAIIIDTIPLNADLTKFWSTVGVSQSTGNIESIDAGMGATHDANNAEDTLDVSWSSSIAPACKVRVYETDDLQFTSIDNCLSQLATDVTGTSPTQPQIHALSMSLGLGEQDLGIGNSEFTTEDYYFTMITNGSTANGGVSVFVAAGDAGSTPDDTGHGTGGPLQAEYESTDPMVTGVGGTALLLNTSTGLRSSEVVWDDATAGSYYGIGATGGGTSAEWVRPAWQKGTGVPAVVPGVTPARLAPDVALVGAGSTACFLVFTDPSTGAQNGYYISGTSWSAPTWAGFSALINQGRVASGRKPLGFLNSRIYSLINSNNFYDITSGNNALGANANGNYFANVGYDECTGVGVPDVANLLATMLAAAPTITSFTISGSVGQSVTITGTGFNFVGNIYFNGTDAPTFTVNNPTSITVTVPFGATTGPITVVAASDPVKSSSNFTVTPAPDLTVVSAHTGNFTEGDNGDTYTLTVSNVGTLAASKAVTLTDTLDTANAYIFSASGTGWTCVVSGGVTGLRTATCTRADTLESGASYPPVTLVVDVNPASALVFNNRPTVSVSGDADTANNFFVDATTVVAATDTPTLDWRYQYFGTTANSGNAADTANPSGDGLPNLVKYALGLDPTKPAVSTVTMDTSTGYLRLTVPKNPAATDVTYTVQGSNDLTNPAGWSTTGTTVTSGTSNPLQVRDNTSYPPASGTARRFLRLLISR